MTRILAVTAEPRGLRALKTNLEARNYDTVHAATGAQALTEASRNPPDAVILDLDLPDTAGITTIRGLREHSSTPILALCRSEDIDQVTAALDAGADDCLTKPFDMDELLARLRAALRRPALRPGDSPGTVMIGSYLVDSDRRAIRSRDDIADRGPAVHLSATEWRLLTHLLWHPRQVISNADLLTAVWGPGHEEHGEYLRVYFNSLRRKLESDPAHPRHLITNPGMGHRFEP